MKTLLFTLEYPPFKGGVANYYGHVVEHWSNPENILVLDNNDNTLIKNWLWPKWLPAIWHLWHTIKKQKIEHVLVGHILPLGTVAYYVTKLTKTSYSVFLHGMDFTYALRKPRKKRITKRILVKAEHIICANSYTAGLVKEFVGKEYESRVVVVNPGINPLTAQNLKLSAQLKERYKLKNKIVLFSIGRLVKRKGFDNVIETMPEVVKSVPNLFYFLAGDGPDKIYIKEKAKGVPNIFFLGQINDEEKWAWLNLCDIFIMPTREIRRGATNAAHANNKMKGGDFEGFGIVYLEANLACKPVIAGESGGVGDAVINMENGLFVNSENVGEISHAITKLALDKNLRKKLGEQGRQRALKNFKWGNKVKLIYNLIIHNA